MTHEGLVKLALGVHGSVLLAAIVAFYRYGDRTELLEKGLRGSDSIFTEMRRRIATELADALRAYFEPGQAVPTIITGTQAAYVERISNSVESEGFRETVRDFVEGHSVVMADYRKLLDARESWCGWGRFLSWALLALLAAEAGIVGALALVDKLFGYPLSNSIIQWSWFPVAVLVAACLLPLPIMLRKHDFIAKCKITYESF